MTGYDTKPGCLGRLLQLLTGLFSGGGGGSGGTSGGRWPYRRRQYLFSRAEFSFFRVLQQVAAQQDWAVCPKVNLSDLLYLEKGLSASDRQRWLNRINRKHADFVLCDAATMQPIAVVELDDASHSTAPGNHRTQQRDAVKDQALHAAGLPLVRVKAQKAYAVEALRAHLLRGLDPTP